MKRSHNICLFVLGGASTGAFTGCSPGTRSGPAKISSQSYYTNNVYVKGVGYYHAPFRAFYSWPYNYYNTSTKQYFYGGGWGPTPYESPINISSPPDIVANNAELYRTDVIRGGFGSSSHYYGGGWS